MNVTQNVSLAQSPNENEPSESLPSDHIRPAACTMPSGIVKIRTAMQSTVPVISTMDCMASVQMTASTPPSIEYTHVASPTASIVVGTDHPKSVLRRMASRYSITPDRAVCMTRKHALPYILAHAPKRFSRNAYADTELRLRYSGTNVIAATTAVSGTVNENTSAFQFAANALAGRARNDMDETRVRRRRQSPSSPSRSS